MMSTVQQCKTDPGRRRERSGACARAVPMGQGVGRVWRPPAPRVERALPFSDEFWCFGPDKGPSIVFGQATRAAGAAAARVVEGVFCGARHAPPSGATAASRAARASTVASRGRRGRCTRPRATMWTRLWRTTRTSRCSARRGAALGDIKKKKPRRRAKWARCVKGSGKTQLGGADRAEHAWLEKTALPLGV